MVGLATEGGEPPFAALGASDRFAQKTDCPTWGKALNLEYVFFLAQPALFCLNHC